MIALVPESWGSALLEYNPNHEPKGSPKGGRFAKATGSGATAVRESAGDHKGILVALWVKPDVAKKLARLGTEMGKEMHVTLSYSKTGTFEQAARAIADVAKKARTRLYGHTIGVGTFPPSTHSDDKTVVWAKPYVPGMATLRSQVVKALAKAGVTTARDFGDWVPHITLAYVDKKGRLPEVPKLPLVFDAITVAQGERRQTFPIGGARP